MRDVFQRILFICILRDETSKRNLAYLQTVLELSSMELKRLHTYVGLVHSKEVMQKIDYLMKEVGLSKEEIIKYAGILRHTPERIKARYEFARICGLTAKSPNAIVQYSDARFAKLCGRKIEEYREFYDSIIV